MREFAEELAMSAGNILKENFGKIKTVDSKGMHQLVTNVDREAEDFIRSEIKKTYPDHSILGEEMGEEKNDSEYLWVIDPLDGTNNYIHGLPMFGVSIAVCRNRKPIVGVIYLPILDRLYSAEKGKGAHCNGKKISVSKTNLDSDSFVMFDSYMHEKTESQIDIIRKIMKSIDRIRISGSSIFDMVSVADGNAELTIDNTHKQWDIAAGGLIVEEAGGKVTDNNGNPWTIDTESIVSSNGIVHEEILEMLK